VQECTVYWGWKKGEKKRRKKKNLNFRAADPSLT